jgi:hypothetical protein
MRSVENIADEFEYITKELPEVKEISSKTIVLPSIRSMSWNSVLR